MGIDHTHLPVLCDSMLIVEPSCYGRTSLVKAESGGDLTQVHYLRASAGRGTGVREVQLCREGRRGERRDRDRGGEGRGVKGREKGR